MTTTAPEIIETIKPAAFARGRTSLAQSVWYAGWLTTFLATGEDTQGQFALLEQTTRRGNVPPRHTHHREDEIFYVVEGEMTFSIGDQTIKATPGTMVFAPRGIPHSFTIDSDQVRILVMMTPAGLEGFFRECSVPAPAMTLPPPAAITYGEIQKMKTLMPKYGFEFAAPAH